MVGGEILGRIRGEQKVGDGQLLLRYAPLLALPCGLIWSG